MVFLLAIFIVLVGAVLALQPGWVRAVLGASVILYGPDLFVRHASGNVPVTPPYLSLPRVLKAGADLASSRRRRR